MADSQELEVKFYVTDLAGLVTRLQALRAICVQPRQHELNLRFDHPAQQLEASGQVLRLRQDRVARLTYKGQGINWQGVHARTEIELQVDDFQQAQALLEALGYQIRMIYEKYRAAYALGGVEVVLDEMPYGAFVEIEGPDVDSIRSASQALGLEWAARALTSYAGLFKHLQQQLDLNFRDLTFANFEGLQILVEDLGMRQADA